MPDPGLIDYYAALNLPPTADLAGVESAYARISDELVHLARHDEEHANALKEVNKAYAVLSNPALRRDYDAVFLARERAAEARRLLAIERRQALKYKMMFGALLVVVLGQLVALGWVMQDQVSTAAEVVLGPLYPGGAG